MKIILSILFTCCFIFAGFLMVESSDKNVLKDPAMLKRLNEMDKMDNEDKTHIVKVIDAFIKSIKLKDIAAF
ncbi:hypothetical protein OF897_12350 [Chryseobacterium formosus]|uniref:Uncharacterized protein n=1 Tax=Chryseobacterium formosus TaxID=1537363 RepID=A0ABT3XRH2_9FLAO|nr:hypothetical protein [Chryseobacterium formosus]MCX8524705.1 hypothetical protein [Chryseobacterium formosus]